jgi:hypothetical protein
MRNVLAGRIVHNHRSFSRSVFTTDRRWGESATLRIHVVSPRPTCPKSGRKTSKNWTIRSRTDTSTAPAMDAAVNYGSTAVTLRTLLTQTRDEAKIKARRLILADVEAEGARLSRLIEELRTQGLL